MSKVSLTEGNFCSNISLLEGNFIQSKVKLNDIKRTN